MSLETGRGDRDRMRRALGQAIARFGGVRNISGISLVALLCAGAFAPLAASWSAAALAGVVGNAGAEALSGVVTQALDALRGRDRGRPASREEIERAVAAGLETALAEPGEHGTAVREAACELLRELGATRALVEQAREVGGQTQALVVLGLTRLAELGAQFGEFASLGEDIEQATWRIEGMVREHLAEARAADERLREHGMMLAQIRDLLGRGERATPIAASAWPECPYLGLTPFTAREERIFFGRDVPVDQLREKLKDRLDGGGLLLVTGASGAGKSSLLRAGLVPRLSREGVFARGSARWPCRVLTPHDAPLWELAAGLAGLLPDMGSQEVFEGLSRDAGQAARFAADAARAAGGPGAHLILIVDQFEELFTLAAHDVDGHTERRKFVDALKAMAAPVEPGGQPAALVVVAVRGDFLDQALAYPPLADAHDRGPFAVRPMTERELRDAVAGPAGEAGVGIDDDLVEEVVREARAKTGSPTVEAGALPLVSQALRATWERCEGQRLTLSAYRAVGGLANAVDRDATAALKSLDEPLRDVARMVFVRLTLVTADERVVRLRVSRAELARSTGGQPEQVDKVVDVFARRRLLVLERDYAEISHDVLLQTWTELHAWLDADRVDRAAYGRLVTDAEAWSLHEKDASYLYPANRRAEISGMLERWAQADPQRYPVPSETAVQFLADSAEAERVRSGRRRRAIAGLIALTVLAVGAAVGAGVAAQRARHDEAAVRAETSVAVSRQLAVEALGQDPTDPYIARQLAAAAWSVAPTVQAGQTEATLLDEQRGTIITPDRAIDWAAFSPDGTMIATAGRDGKVRLWDPVTQQQIGAPFTVGQNVDVSQAAFSPDGSLLAASSEKGVVALWSVKTHRQVGRTITATGNGAGVLGLAFNPSGTLLATAGGDGTARLWDPASGRPIGAAIPVTGAGTAVSTVVFSPDGALLATGDGSGNVRLWNVGTHRQVGRTIRAAATGAVGAIFNSQGTLLATTGDDGSLRLWNPATQDPVGSPMEAVSGFAELAGAFNPAGSLLATGGAGGTVRLWNPATQRQVGATIPATSDKSLVWSVAFSPSGTLLATAGDDGAVRLWNPDTQQIASGITATGNRSAVSDVAFDPSGKLLATAGDDGRVRLWNPANEQQVGHDMVAAGNGGPATSLAFSPSGALLATAGGDGAVRLWNPATQQQIGTAIPAAPQGRVASIAFDRSGAMLATGDDHGGARLWDPSTRRQIGSNIRATDDGSTVTGVAFSPFGALLATAGGDGAIRLWNPATQHQVGTTINFNASVSNLVFSPSGALLATAGGDGSVRLFNPVTQHQVGATITPGGNSIVWDVAFSPRGDILADADAEGRVRFWNPATGQPLGAGNGTTDDGGGAVLKVAFNPRSTLLATANGNGTSTLVNVQQQTDPHRYLCEEYGLPLAPIWSQYAETQTIEPKTC